MYTVTLFKHHPVYTSHERTYIELLTRIKLIILASLLHAICYNFLNIIRSYYGYLVRFCNMKALNYLNYNKQLRIFSPLIHVEIHITQIIQVYSLSEVDC